MMDERFTHGNSLLHKLSAKVKLVVAVFFVAVIAVSQSFTAVTAGLVLAAALFMTARLDLSPAMKRLAGANFFTIFLWITLPLTYGEQTTAVGPLQLSLDGLRLAALITLKTNTILLSLMALLSTSSVANIGHALKALHISDRLSFLLLFSYRYIFVIHQEYLRLTRAARLRCFVPGTNLHTYRTVGYLFGMTLVKSWNRSSRIHQAMLLRGFDGKLIPMDQQAMTYRDIVFLLVALTATGSLILLQLL
ncbi:cobalt ECF transporter T component CbiQ [Desulforhopalus singaporensis]|uniref:Cobalt/nickel transport system permease protein n=1 Tax=Desulforhopalus singaporensis TaxID=91360 RepID=A0A1H0KT42_9BACT|nr:cobalt ECF transporter T component CbiQ [Desulforhopalus singaporensis]SDO58952.1 cobalt/nickel transport system permease protein [Desulforhopalus singaporensis]